MSKFPQSQRWELHQAADAKPLLGGTRA